MTNLDDIVQVISVETKDILNDYNASYVPIMRSPSLNRKVIKPQETNLSSKSIAGGIIETQDFFLLTQQDADGNQQDVARKLRERVLSHLTGQNKIDKFRAIRHISFLYL